MLSSTESPLFFLIHPFSLSTSLDQSISTILDSTMLYPPLILLKSQSLMLMDSPLHSFWQSMFSMFQNHINLNMTLSPSGKMCLLALSSIKFMLLILIQLIVIAQVKIILCSCWIPLMILLTSLRMEHYLPEWHSIIINKMSILWASPFVRILSIHCVLLIHSLWISKMSMILQFFTCCQKTFFIFQNLLLLGLLWISLSL